RLSANDERVAGGSHMENCYPNHENECENGPCVERVSEPRSDCLFGYFSQLRSQESTSLIPRGRLNIGFSMNSVGELHQHVCQLTAPAATRKARSHVVLNLGGAFAIKLVVRGHEQFFVGYMPNFILHASPFLNGGQAFQRSFKRTRHRAQG